MLLTFVEPLLDTLGPLLIRREDEDVSATATNATIIRLDERIAAQLDALSVTGGESLSSFVGDETHAWAVLAAWVVSAKGADHERAWKHLLACDLAKAALMIGVVTRQGGPAWRQFARSQSPSVLTSVCGELPAMAPWLTHESPVIRAWAWGHLSADLMPTDDQVDAALADPATNAVCVAHLCQRRAVRLNRVRHDDLCWAARLAEQDTAAAVAEKLWATRNGFDDLASLGRMADVDRLIDMLTHPDPVMAIAAGVAFTLLTGADIASEQRVTLPAAEGDDPVFADDAWLPDQHRAQQAWQALKPKLGDAWRIARGFRVEDPDHPELPRSARRDLLLRRCRAG